MNRISEEKLGEAISLFYDGESIRSVCKKVGIAKETAHRIQKLAHMADLSMSGYTKVLTGKRKDGSIGFYYTKETRITWEGPISRSSEWGLELFNPEKK